MRGFANEPSPPHLQDAGAVAGLGKTACESLTDPVFEEQDSSRESWGQCDDLGSVALFSGAFWFCYRVRISNADRAPSACYSARKILSASSRAQPLERQCALTTPHARLSTSSMLWPLLLLHAATVLPFVVATFPALSLPAITGHPRGRKLNQYSAVAYHVR